ncbi:amidohydrolase [Aureococcus anophagefferens]|nr:amidohydrolase [Aureococcus anophagefferens]
MQRRHAAASDAAGGGWEKSDAPSIEALEAPPVKRPAVPPLRRGARGLKGKKARRPRDPNFEPGGPPLAAVVVFALLAFGVLGYHLYCHHYVPDALPISSVVANDLHGIHDLLTAGAAGVFLLDGDRAVVVEAAERLAKLLPQIHPLAECRARSATPRAGGDGTGPTAASRRGRRGGARVQCSRATQHIVPLADCARNDRPCQTPGMEAEKRDIYAFRQWIKSRKHVSAWDTYVVLHNLVTDGLLSGDVKRFECADRAYDALPAFLTPDAPRKPRVKAGGGVAGSLPPGVALPGVGPHRLLACADLESSRLKGRDWLGMRAILLAVACAEARLLIDTHVHNADLTLGIDYGFPAMFPNLNKSWSMADFRGATTSSRFEGAEIQAILMTLEKKNASSQAEIVAEARFYQAVADASGRKGATTVRGFVGGVDLEAGAAPVAALKASFPGLLGVRQGLWHQPPSFFRDPDVLDDLRALAAAAPNCTFNLNHLGYPPLANATGMASWAAALRRLAELENVYCKLSGLPQTFAAPGWTAADFVPAVRVALDAFSTARLNYAGNWFVLEAFPADPASAGSAYGPMLDAVDDALGALGVYGADRDRVYAGTAMELYGL